MAEGLSAGNIFQRFFWRVNRRERRKLNSHHVSGRLEEDRTKKEIFCRVELGALGNTNE